MRMKKNILGFSFFIISILSSQAQSDLKLDSLAFTPEWFSNLAEAEKNPDKVWYLDLGLQKLKQFPASILTLKNIRHLYLSVNYWSKIPDEIGSLSQLEILDISSNYYLRTLPEGLKNAASLKELIIKDNKLKAGEIEKFRILLPKVKFVTD